MPNWITNKVTIRGNDQEALQAMADAILSEDSGSGLFQHLKPCPSALEDTIKGSYGSGPEQIALEERQAENVVKYGYPTWYEFNCDNWGTKWDTCHADVISITEGELVLLFDTAWSPPIPIFEHLHEKGFEVIAYWYEEGIQSWGSFVDGEISEGSPDNWDSYDSIGPRLFYENALPESFLRVFPNLYEYIEEYQADWEEEQVIEEDLADDS